MQKQIPYSLYNHFRLHPIIDCGPVVVYQLPMQGVYLGTSFSEREDFGM